MSSHHDRPPWSKDYDDDGDIIGILLIEDGGIIGATGFIKEREYRTIDDVLIRENWVWGFAFIDPQYRRKSYLTKRLPEWKSRFGDFTSDRPWSEAVRALFEEIGWFPAGEESLERTEAELNKLKLKEFERAGVLSRRWIRKNDDWIQLLKRK